MIFPSSMKDDEGPEDGLAGPGEEEEGPEHRRSGDLFDDAGVIHRDEAPENKDARWDHRDACPEEDDARGILRHAPLEEDDARPIHEEGRPGACGFGLFSRGKRRRRRLPLRVLPLPSMADPDGPDGDGAGWTLRELTFAEASAEDASRFLAMSPAERVRLVPELLLACLSTRGMRELPRIRRVYSYPSPTTRVPARRR